MKKTVIYIILSGWMFAGCGTYSRYHRPDLSTENLYRDVPADIDTTTIASLSWREMFTDPKLQSLIETGLERNTDLNVARLRVEATEAVLMTARLSYLPSLGLTAEGNANKHDGATAKTYNVGASASWELDIFGKLTAAKRGAAAALQGSRAYRQAVQTQLVATIADSYYTLAMLDAQMAISNRTLENWRTTVRTLEALKKVGKSNEAGVLQAKANVMRLEASLLSIRKSISETEKPCLRYLPCRHTRLDEVIWPRLLSPILSRLESLCNCFPTVPTCVRLKWNWRRRSTPPMRLVPPSIPILPSRGLLDGLITAVA